MQYTFQCSSCGKKWLSCHDLNQSIQEKELVCIGIQSFYNERGFVFMHKKRKCYSSIILTLKHCKQLPEYLAG